MAAVPEQTPETNAASVLQSSFVSNGEAIDNKKIWGNNVIDTKTDSDDAKVLMDSLYAQLKALSAGIKAFDKEISEYKANLAKKDTDGGLGLQLCSS